MNKLLATLLLLSLPILISGDYSSFEFGNIVTGDISGYDKVAPGVAPVWKNDASGAAVVDGVNIVVDDLMSSVRMWYSDLDESSGVNFPLPTVHKDLEGATQIDGKVYITCSMTSPTDNNFNRISRYDVASDKLALLNEETVVMRPQILNALNSTLGQIDPAWFPRTQLFGEKDGNLNIEGLSATPRDSRFDFVWGLRAPLFSPEFATFTTINGKRTQILDKGEAILVFARNVFPSNEEGDDNNHHDNNDNDNNGDHGNRRRSGYVGSRQPEFYVETINLNGQGIRAIEYVPALEGYLISSGPVPKADIYRLWLYKPSRGHDHPSSLTEISSKLPQFLKLGRPEAILLRGGNKIAIFSEEDPTFTVNPEFNFIGASINIVRDRHDDDNEHGHTDNDHHD
jgi:hypothetical protein